MAFASRLLAPVAAPPPPKPPQLNLVASALMPDVSTDTFGPGGGPSLTAAALAEAGWESRPATGREGRSWTRPPGDQLWRTATERRNALIAAGVGVLPSYIGMQQTETPPILDPIALPTSVFPATMRTRWTGGFAWAPENQNPGVLADPCGQSIDLPALPAPTGVTGTAAAGGGTLPAATYQYKVTATNANGETVPSSASTGAVLGSTGHVTVAWSAVTTASGYNVYRNVSGTYRLIGATTTALTFADTATGTPGAAAPSANTTGGPGVYTNLPQLGFIPFLIQVEDECSTWGWEVRDYVGRALRLLDNATPNAIEREFWTGAFAQNTLTGPIYNGSAGPALNAFLQQGATASAGGTGVVAEDLTPGSGGVSPCSITRGIQILEDYLANTGFGGQGMLHVAPETSPNLLGARRVGALLLTVMDNIVVPGSGYPTSGTTGPIGNTFADPGDGNQWIFATDLVSVRLDDPMVFPSTMAEAVDRGNFGSPNTVRFRAQRFAAATFDVARLAACRVTLPS